MREKLKTTGMEDVLKWTRQPVVVVLQDGSFYVGWITGADEESLTLAGQRGLGKMKKTSLSTMDKAKISAFLPGNQAFTPAAAEGWSDPFGFSPVREVPQAGGGIGWGGLGGFFGFMKQVWPGVKIGMGIVRAVMPLMGGFKL